MIQRRTSSISTPGILLAAWLLAGCSGMPTLPSIAPYKMDIQQGNVVTQEMVSKLKPGMTRNQVRFALGTPLVVDPFHADRWDYVYRHDKGGETKEYRRIVVIFQEDKLARIEGDVVPASARSATESGSKLGKPKPAAAPAKPEAAAPAAAGPKPEVAAPSQPEGARLVTSTGEAVTSGGTSAETTGGAEKAKEEKPKEPKPQEERSFFDRILEKLGF